MSSINEIFSNILKDIIPKEEELALIKDIVQKLKILLEKRAKELNIPYTEMEPQGSTGIKQTQLSNDFDIDFFVGLDYENYKPRYEGLSKNKLKKESKAEFLDLCNNWIKRALTSSEFKNPRLLYAQHPYVTVDYITPETKIKVDIVLYFDLPLEYIKENGPITAVDRSPWHGRFVRDNLSNDQKNDVRLLKQFFKACHSYGDKSPVGKVGFIGYSAELLIYHFGTIQDLFEKFETLTITPLDIFKRTAEKLKEIKHFESDFLILIDPIDMNRNVASAISEKAYKYCTHRVKEFLKNPNESFLKIEPITEINLSDGAVMLIPNIFLMELSNKNEDVHYTINRDKLYSLGDSIEANGEKEFSHADRFGNIIFEVYFEDKTNEYNLAIYCEKPNISETYQRRGPPLGEKSHVEKFKQKNQNIFEKDGYLWVHTKRNYTCFFDFLKDFVKKKLPENLEVINISNSLEVKTHSGKKAITVLKDMILPFYL